MKKLSELITILSAQQVLGDTDRVITDIVNDNRNHQQIHPGSVFFAIPGVHHDGHNFIHTVIESGCAVVVCQVLPIDIHQSVTYVVVDSTTHAWAVASQWWFDNPSDGMTLVAVTGTNGKTTVATLIYQLWQQSGIAGGLVSTIESRYCAQIVTTPVSKFVEHSIPSTHTTPDAYHLAQLLRTMRDAGVTHVVMEASSHAIAQHRIDGLLFHVAVFTNLTQDHLDFHGTMEQYALEKQKLFSQYVRPDGVCIINADDMYGPMMAQDTGGTVSTYGIAQSADYGISDVQLQPGGTIYSLADYRIESKLVGMFNVYNLTAALLAVHACGQTPLDQLQHLALQLHAPKGRLEVVHSNHQTVLIDYAHTPDGLQQVLSATRELLNPHQKLVVVFGCGGDRDRGKRPKMAHIAEQLADVIIITTDNPRTEDQDQIFADIVAGCTQNPAKHSVIVDRADAIRYALEHYPNDVILVAGKGHEEYQIIGTEKVHFSDHEVVRDFYQITG